MKTWNRMARAIALIAGVVVATTVGAQVAPSPAAPAEPAAWFQPAYGANGVYYHVVTVP